MKVRFRISELLYVTATIAAGCGVAQLRSLSWPFGAFITAIIMSIPLIVRESLALHRAAKSSTAASRDERFELSFLAWSRLVALLIFVAAVAWHVLEAAELISSIANDDSFELHDPGPRGRSALLYMSFIICITSPTLLAPLRRSNIWKLIIDVAAIAAAIALATIILWNETFIEALVYIAIRGVEQAAPTGALPPGREIQFAHHILSVYRRGHPHCRSGQPCDHSLVESAKVADGAPIRRDGGRRNPGLGSGVVDHHGVAPALTRHA